jgi:hypothetical protein
MATESTQLSGAKAPRDTVKSQIEAGDSRVLVHCPAPIGWIGLTADQLRAAQIRATEILSDKSPNGGTTLADRSDGCVLRTPQDAARVLAVDVSWLLRQAREGAIPHVRLGKYIRFDPAAIADQCASPPRPPATATGSAPFGRRTRGGGNQA